MWQLVNGQAVDLPYQIGTPIQSPFGASQQSVPYNFQGQQQTPAYGSNNAPKISSNKIYVSGIEGARSYQLAPNTEMLLCDDSKDIVYDVVVDVSGKRTVTALDVSVHEETPPIDISALQGRVQKLEELYRKKLKAEKADEDD